MNKAKWATRRTAWPTMEGHLVPGRRAGVAAALGALGLAVAMPGHGQGLPFTETFDDAALSDAATTTADWGATQAGQLTLPTAVPLTEPFGNTTVAEDIGTEAQATRSLALADMDGDGDLDLIEGGMGPNGVFLNDEGTFPLRMPITEDGGNGGNTRGIAAGDMDSDGDLDVVTGNLNGRVRLYLNGGDGVQYAGSDVSTGSWQVDSIALADFNGDGHLDVAASVQGNNFDRVFFNTGDPSAPFGAAGLPGEPVFQRTDDAQVVLAGDMDNDGDIDLVLINEAEVNVLYLNDGTGTFSTPIEIGSETDNSQGGALGDLNGDGFLDLVVGNYVVDEANRIYLNTGDPDAPFSAGHIPVDFTAANDPAYAHDVTLGDVDNDGDLDIVLSTAGIVDPVVGTTRFTNRLYLNDGAGGFGVGLGIDIGAETDITNNSVIGDIDEDGKADIIVGNEGRDATTTFGVVNRLYRNVGTLAATAAVRQLSARATSVEVDAETDEIATVTLTAVPDSIGLHNEADFWVSSDAGDNWLHAVPGRPVVFPEGIRGADLRWRVFLNSWSPAAGSAEALAIDTVTLTTDAPTFTSLPVTDATVDTAYSYAVTTTDPDAGDTRTIAATTKPDWLTFTDNADGTGTLEGTPTSADVGAHPVVLQVTDTAGSTTSQSFTVTVSGGDQAPAFTSDPVTEASEGVEYSYSIVATDPDAGAVLVLSAPTLPAWLTLTDNGDGTGTLAGTPAAGDVGDHTVELRVADDTGAQAVQNFTVAVAGAGGSTNSAPSFTSTAETSATAGTAFSYEVAAADPDAGDTLTLSAPTLPAWLALEDNGDGTGTLSGTPAAGDVGDHDVVLEVTDASGEAALQNFTVTVEAAAAPPPPPPSNGGGSSGGGGGSTGLGELLGLVFLAALIRRRRRGAMG